MMQSKIIGQYACVCVCLCVWLLCHSDDVAHRGLSFHPLACCWEPLDPRGLLDGGISRWEETAEACVASALANQHSTSAQARTHATTPLYSDPWIIPHLTFFCRPLSTGVRHPQRPPVTKVKRGRTNVGKRGQRHTEVLGQSCLRCWVIIDAGSNWGFHKLDGVLFWNAQYKCGTSTFTAGSGDHHRCSCFLRDHSHSLFQPLAHARISLQNQLALNRVDVMYIRQDQPDRWASYKTA